MPRRMAFYDYSDPAIAAQAIWVTMWSVSRIGGAILVLSECVVLHRAGARADRTVDRAGAYRFSVAGAPRRARPPGQLDFHASSLHLLASSRRVHQLGQQSCAASSSLYPSDGGPPPCRGSLTRAPWTSASSAPPRGRRRRARRAAANAQTDEFIGRIQAVGRVALVARVTAFLEKRLFVEGSEVKQGISSTSSSSRRFRRRSTSTRRTSSSSRRSTAMPS